MAILAAALIAAFAFAITVSRSLQDQIERLLDGRAAHGAAATSRAEVPTEGSDEFAALGDRVQQDVAPARGAARGAPARARAPARGDPARRRDVRQTSTATRCSRSSCRPRSTASAPTPAARALRTEPAGRFEEVAGEGDVDRSATPSRAAEAAVLDAGTPWRPSWATRTRSRTRCAPQDGGPHPRPGVRRARRPGLHRRRARAVPLPRRPGRRLDRERRTSTRRSSARRSPTSSPACPTTAASRR